MAAVPGGDSVACHASGAVWAFGVAGADKQAVRAGQGDEPGLGPGGGRAGTDGPFEADAEGFGVAAGGGDLPVGAGGFRNAPVRDPARDVLQPEPFLQISADRSGFAVVVTRAGLGAVFADQVDRDVDVVVAFCGRAVADGDPPARGLPSLPEKPSASTRAWAAWVHWASVRVPSAALRDREQCQT